MPEKAFKKFNSYILPQWKVCFFAALLIGLVAHLYKITNWLPNWDSLVFRYDSQNMLGLGRWFLPVVCSFSSFYDLPLLNGVLAIFFHAFAAVCVCKTLKIENKITAGLIGAVIVSFPTVTSVMMYNYVADGYAISFLLAVLAALYMTREKPRYIVSAILITLSMGIYQAYITVTITLVLLSLIDKAVFKGASFALVFKKALCMLLSGVCGALLYSVILKVVLSVCSVEILDYQGASQALSLSNINLPASLYIIKETFIGCFFDLSNGINVFVVLNGFILLFTVFYYVKSIVTNKLYKKPAILFAVILLSVLFFFGACALAFVNPSVDYHNLMLMGYSSFYIMFLMLYERGTEKQEKYTSFKKWVVLLAAVVIVANQVVVANVSYHKAQMAYEKSYGVLIRIADRIEQTPEAENCDRLLVIGALENSDNYSVKLFSEITGITDGYIVRADDEMVGQSVFTSSLNDYCGKNYSFISGEEKKQLTQREDLKALESWPSKNCVSVVDDIVVIKLGEEGEN